MSLETLSNENTLDKKTLENLLDTLVDIKRIYVSKTEFNNQKNSGILVKSWELYNLYLPEKINLDDYLLIIRELNKHSFWDNLPEYSSVNELKKVFLTKIDILIEMWQNEDNIIKLIEYLSYYLKLFPEEKSKLLLTEKYRNFVIELGNINEKKQCLAETNQSLSELLKNLSISKNPINTVEEFSDEITYKSIDKQVLKEFWEHFDEAFFEQWIENLRKNMMTFTKKDAEKLRWELWKIIFRVEDWELDEKPRKLRDAIWIDKLKKELEEVRKTWNQEEISKKEVEASNAILRGLYKYPYEYTRSDYWYQPNKLEKHKEIYCIWFSLLWHAFLSELWIKHNWLQIPEHSALEIIIWWKNYYFDASWDDYFISEFNYWKTKGIYREIKIDNSSSFKGLIAYSWNTEKILLSQIYNNKWAYLSINEEAIKMYDKSIELNLEDSEVYFNKWISLNKLWKINISKLYEFTSKYLSWDNIDKEEQNYLEEKSKIRKLIDEKDFEWLRLYLLDLEGKESITKIQRPNLPKINMPTWGVNLKYDEGTE